MKTVNLATQIEMVSEDIALLGALNCLELVNVKLMQSLHSLKINPYVQQIQKLSPDYDRVFLIATHDDGVYTVQITQENMIYRLKNHYLEGQEVNSVIVIEKDKIAV